jgi:hypothetical protein
VQRRRTIGVRLVAKGKIIVVYELDIVLVRGRPEAYIALTPEPAVTHFAACLKDEHRYDSQYGASFNDMQ